MSKRFRVMCINQDKGGEGKTLVTRALAETVPAATIFEVENGERLLELKGRVKHFEARATLAEIQATGGRAARSEFYGLIDALAEIDGPAITDIGANTSGNVLAVLSANAQALDEAGIDLGFLLVVTSDPSSIANARAHAAVIAPFAKAKFALQNKIERGSVSVKPIGLGQDFIVTTLEDAALRDEGKELLDAAGLKGIAQLDGVKLRKRYGFAVGGELQVELARLRYEAMKAVEPAAVWLTGAAND